jgi:hypothetical protein
MIRDKCDGHLVVFAMRGGVRYSLRGFPPVYPEHFYKILEDQLNNILSEREGAP